MPGWLPPARVARRLGLPPDDPDLPDQIAAVEDHIERALGYGPAAAPTAPDWPDPVPKQIIEAGIKAMSNLRQNPSANFGGGAGSAFVGQVYVAPDILAGAWSLLAPFALANAAAGIV